MVRVQVKDCLQVAHEHLSVGVLVAEVRESLWDVLWHANSCIIAGCSLQLNAVEGDH